MQKGWGKFTL